MPRSTAGELVYALGDVHGCYGLMKSLLAELARDWAQRAAGRRPVLVFCGDYVDRGPQSAEVVQALVHLKRRADIDLHLLKGNHEQALLGFLEDPVRGGPWLRFGGLATLASYGVAAPDGSEDSLFRARDELLDRMPASHLVLLRDLELMVTIGDFAFVHAGVRPGTPLNAQSENDLLWLREGFLDVEEPFEKVIVHGHTWLDERPQLLPNRLGLDTGAYATGVLSAVRLDGDDLGLMQAGRQRAAA